MAFNMFSMGKTLLLSSCAILCSVGIFGIPRCLSWYHSIFLATSSSSWLTWAFYAILDILCLLACNFPIRFGSGVQYEVYI